MRITLSSYIRIKNEDIIPELSQFIQGHLTYSNPKYKNAVEYSKSRKAEYIPKFIEAFHTTERYTYISRGFLRPLLMFLDRKKVKYKLVDKTVTNKSGLVLPRIKLRTYQKNAAVKAIRLGNGVIKMPCGAGKTITLTDVIRRLQQHTLIIVHTNFIMNQWKNYFLEKYGYEPGVIQGDTSDIKPITIAMIPTLYQRHLSKKFLKHWGCVVVDECFHPDTSIMLPSGNYASIKNICEKDEYTHVMSFNVKTKKYEAKRIIRKIVSEHNARWLKITIQASDGTVRVLKTTSKHKFWTTKGYVQAKDLTDKDILKLDIRNISVIHICEYCDNEYPGRSIEAHRRTKHGDNSAFFAGEKWYNNKESSDKVAKKISESLSKSEKHARANSIRAKKRWEDPEYRKYISEKSSYWHRNVKTEEQKEEAKRNFINAPRHNNWQITKLEKQIIDFGIYNLRFTGDGKIWLTSNGVRMNPDFVVNGEKKVVEVGDTNYWHNDKDISERIKLYEEIGWKCLYIKDKHLEANPNKVKKIIEQFIYNHKAQVVKIEYTCGRLGKFRYNLEVEDNHNYFANGVLVSNCHRVPADSFFNVVNLFPAKYRFGTTATARRNDGLTDMVFATLGEIIYNVKTSTLSRKHYLTIPKVKIVNTSFIARTNQYQNVIKELCANRKRNALIIKNLYRSKDRFNLVLSSRIEHLQKLVNEYAKLTGDYELVTGSTKAVERNEIIARMVRGDLHTVFSTQLADEGLDIPNLDTVHLVYPTKADSTIEQRIGRVQRYKDHTPLVYDYVDQLVPKFYNFTSNRLNLYRELELEIEEN